VKFSMLWTFHCSGLSLKALTRPIFSLWKRGMTHQLGWDVNLLGKQILFHFLPELISSICSYAQMLLSQINCNHDMYVHIYCMSKTYMCIPSYGRFWVADSTQSQGARISGVWVYFTAKRSWNE
jgi:hypothetical protein